MRLTKANSTVGIIVSIGAGVIGGTLIGLVIAQAFTLLEIVVSAAITGEALGDNLAFGLGAACGVLVSHLFRWSFRDHPAGRAALAKADGGDADG